MALFDFINSRLQRPMSRYPLKEVILGQETHEGGEYELVYLSNGNGRLATWDNRTQLSYVRIGDDVEPNEIQGTHLRTFDKDDEVLGTYSVIQLTSGEDPDDGRVAVISLVTAEEKLRDTAHHFVIDGYEYAVE